MTDSLLKFINHEFEEQLIMMHLREGDRNNKRETEIRWLSYSLYSRFESTIYQHRDTGSEGSDTTGLSARADHHEHLFLYLFST